MSSLASRITKGKKDLLFILFIPGVIKVLAIPVSADFLNSALYQHAKGGSNFSALLFCVFSLL